MNPRAMRRYSEGMVVKQSHLGERVLPGTEQRFKHITCLIVEMSQGQTLGLIRLGGVMTAHIYPSSILHGLQAVFNRYASGGFRFSGRAFPHDLC